MAYIIDGHNVIGRAPGMSLSDPEDERQLVETLASYFRLARRNAVLFFDKAAPGARTLRLGRVEARFVAPPRTADMAILDFLRAQRDRRGWIVVTSDTDLATRAHALGARILSSEEFARSLRESAGRAKKESPPDTPGDIEEWLKEFGEGIEPGSRPGKIN